MLASKSTRMVAAAATAALAGFGFAQSAHAALTLTQSYVSIQYSTTSNFTAATTTNVSSGTTALTLPVGDYFRFGVAEALTGNANPEFGSAYDADNQAANGVAMPQFLGLSGYGYSINSTDTLGSSLTPVPVSATVLNAKTAFNNKITQNNTSPGNIVGGNIGLPFTLGSGNLPPSSTESTTTVAPLSQFVATTTAFTGVTYMTAGAGGNSVTITPTLVTGATALYYERTAGVDDGAGNIVSDPTFGTAIFNSNAASTVTTTALAPLVITLSPGGSPMPTPVVSLSTTPPATGTSLGNAAVVRNGPGSYSSATVVFAATTNGFISATGFVTPDQEAYGIQLNQTLGTASQQTALNDLVTYLNANASGGTVVSRTGTLTPAQIQIFKGLPAADQIAFIGATTGTPEYFSFNLSGFSAAFPNDGSFTASSITAVPEPTSIAGLALGIGGLIASRRKRVA